MGNKGKIEYIKNIKKVLQKIEAETRVQNNSSYAEDKDCIEQLFSLTTKRTKSDILTRLTVIDSMYSTQMNRRYYGLEDLTEVLFVLNQKKPLPELFAEFLKKKDVSLFDCKIGNKGTNLFAGHYGISKKGVEKGAAVSLITKYAYFETGLNFPIYDSIVCEMYPIIWKYCGFVDSEQPKLEVYQKGTMRIKGDDTIKTFVKAIDLLIEKLGGNISYDNLDKLMWHTGKICRGNLSLVLDKDEYLQLYQKYGEFDIANMNLDDIKFLKKNSLLYSYFELAKKLKQID